MLESEGALLEAAKGGDWGALEQLLKLHGAEVRAGLSIGRKWQGALEVDDVMQATYFDAFFDIAQFNGDPSSFCAWLKRIAENNLKDAIRALECQKRPQPDDRLMPPVGQDSVVWLYELATATGTTPSGHFARQEMRAMLDAEISKLPEDHARVLRGIYFEEKSVAEMADEMGRTHGAVQLLRIRALKRLQGQVVTDSQLLPRPA